MGVLSEAGRTGVLSGRKDGPVFWAGRLGVVTSSRTSVLSGRQARHVVRREGWTCYPGGKAGRVIRTGRMVVLSGPEGWSCYPGRTDGRVIWAGRMVVLSGSEGWACYLGRKDGRVIWVGRMGVLSRSEGWAYYPGRKDGSYHGSMKRIMLAASRAKANKRRQIQSTILATNCHSSLT
ncbi:hypothetical protein Bbelb_445310 [Branchiostoma belcheri]|nr:hypothetical protein Bbelb_445310 [Branchiostoma belcheri]